jgi:fructosamine-3-kinase
MASTYTQTATTEGQGGQTATNSSGEGLDLEIDANVLSTFPPDTKVTSASLFGTSAWTITARLRLHFSDGTSSQYFLKSAPNEHGKILMEGEYHAMSEIYKVCPHLVPKPHAYGKYAKAGSDTYFFISEYLEMSDKMPHPNYLCAELARLHHESASPNGKYGFHITTCQGRIAQSVDWKDSWTDFFVQILEHVIKLDFKANGHWEDLKRLEDRLIAKVVPRLLNALVENGNTIKPSLIHSDLWEGNSGTSFQNGKVYIFDAASFYAHNEMETGNWRGYYNKISNKEYRRTYLRHFPPSHPKQEWEDRNRLYSIYYNVLYSVNHENQGTAVRQL